MRISDWSSDVCSSDLTRQTQRVRPTSERWPSPDAYAGAEFCHTICEEECLRCSSSRARKPLCTSSTMTRDRKSVVWGKSVSVRVDYGGSRIIKKNTDTNERRTICTKK